MIWEPLASGIYNPVAFTSWPGSLMVLGRGSRNELVRGQWRDGAWQPFEPLGVPVARPGGGAEIPVEWPLAACANGSGAPHLFGRSPDGELLHMPGGTGDWLAFESLGAPASPSGDTLVPMGMAGPPACTPGADAVEVFFIGHNGSLLHTTCGQGEWADIESLGAPAFRPDAATSVPLAGPLAACSCGTGIAVFARGHAGDLLMTRREKDAWSGFASLGSPGQRDMLYPAVTFPVPLAGPPAACSWGDRRIDVFARGIAGDALHRSWNGEYWSQFQSLGTPAGSDGRALPFTGTLTACTPEPGRLDVFGRAVDGQLYHAWWADRWQHSRERQPLPG